MCGGGGEGGGGGGGTPIFTYIHIITMLGPFFSKFLNSIFFYIYFFFCGGGGGSEKMNSFRGMKKL